MKTRDSGMPEETYWQTFFEPEAVLRALGFDHADGPVVDVGCGYGTFTFAAAALTRQRVIAIDIETDLVRRLVQEAETRGLQTVEGVVRDAHRDGFGLPTGSAALVLLFNLLHCEDPHILLREAHRTLTPGGRVGIIHWRSDIPTPRGPELAIRPTPEHCRRWLVESGFTIAIEPLVLAPYHWGLVGQVPAVGGVAGALA